MLTLSKEEMNNMIKRNNFKSIVNVTYLKDIFRHYSRISLS